MSQMNQFAKELEKVVADASKALEALKKAAEEPTRPRSTGPLTRFLAPIHSKSSLPATPLQPLIIEDLPSKESLSNSSLPPPITGDLSTKESLPAASLPPLLLETRHRRSPFPFFLVLL